MGATKRLNWLEEAPVGHPDADQLEYAWPAERLANALRALHPTIDPQNPESRASFIFTIEAPWGSGKTSFSNLVAYYLNEPDVGLNGTESWSSPVLVDFSAWQSVSMGLTPWEALAYRMGEAFYRRLHRLCLEIDRNKKDHLAKAFRIGNPRSLLGPPFSSSHRLISAGRNEAEVAQFTVLGAKWFGEPRLHWLEVAVRLAQSVDAEYWDPCLKIFVEAASKLEGRPLTRDDAIDSVVGLFGGALSSLTGNAKGAISSVTEASRTLLRRRLLEGPEWGIDTREFARALDRLIYVLHPRPRHWRALVVIDDVARLPESELPSILEALTYLREIHDIAVAINVPPRVVESLLRIHAPGVPRTDDRPAGGESFLAKLIHVRFPLPKPDDANLSRMMADALGDLGIPATLSSNVVRHFLSKRSATPRQMKQALQWLWFRLHSSNGSPAPVCREALAPDFDQELLDWLLSLLLDLHLHTEDGSLDAISFRQLHERREIFLYCSLRPWDLRDWRDGFHCPQAAFGSDFPESLDLLAAIRLQDLLVEYQHVQVESGLEAGQRAWRAWQLRIAEENELRLSEDLLKQDPQRLLDQLLERLTPFPERLFVRAQLASTARYHHFADDEPRLADSGRFARMARFLYTDADALWRVVSDPRATPELVIKAWFLLGLVKPELARRHGDSLKRSREITALVPLPRLERVQDFQKGLEELHRRLADGQGAPASAKRER